MWRAKQFCGKDMIAFALPKTIAAPVVSMIAGMISANFGIMWTGRMSRRASGLRWNPKGIKAGQSDFCEADSLSARPVPQPPSPAGRAYPIQGNTVRYRCLNGFAYDAVVKAVRQDGTVDVEIIAPGGNLERTRLLWCDAFSIPCGCVGPSA